LGIVTTVDLLVTALAAAWPGFAIAGTISDLELVAVGAVAWWGLIGNATVVADFVGDWAGMMDGGIVLVDLDVTVDGGTALVGLEVTLAGVTVLMDLDVTIAGW
jgi:hypothetical protein